MECGASADAKKTWEKALELAQAHGLPCEEALAQFGLARLSFYTQLDEQVLPLLDSLYDKFCEVDEPSLISDVEGFRAVVLSRLGKPEEALAACGRAIQEADRSENRISQLRTRRLEGILRYLASEVIMGERLLIEAISAAQEVESEYEAAKGEAWLSKILLQQGKTEEALNHMKKAGAFLSETVPCHWKDVIIDNIENGFNKELPLM
jgi:tetratricopeptide (TPR) repeat protein